MKILFYNPAPSQRRYTPFEALRGSPFFRRPNYDAMRLAYLSRKHQFTYCDEHIEGVGDNVPDIVVIHTPLNLARHVENLVVQKWDEETKTICYGSFPSLFPKQSKEFCSSAVVGDIAAVWNNILADCKKHKIASVYKADKNTQFDVDRRLESKYGFTPFFSQIRTAYGCQCTEENKDYCYENILYENPSQWSIDKVTETISKLQRKAVYVLDDDFMYDIERGMRILEKCWRYKKMWIFQTTGAIFRNPEFFPILRDDGVRVIYLKEDWLGHDLIHNLDNPDYVKEKEHQVNMIHNYRITVGCKIRLGYEGERHNFYHQLLKFLVKLRIDVIELAVQTPLPGTRTYRKHAAKKQIVEDFSLYDQWMPVVNTPGMAPQALYSMMEWLRDRFYSWDSIMLRNIIVSPKLGFYNTVFFYLIPNLSYRSNFLEKVGYPP
ncbi:hypothetical protein AMJ83_04660 [candidate division WOR_3 bacterium SM23_42]|uniref:Uncharacterized protein n=1 Tax=candidate division WOR_3 bacterium SM23_42 TaxID=1703779 RepID=A0A0S8FTB7_UNCW3|nr:MAG: hypothetical protein AMJ83_04660 [candidate division WOR_3 bacterium SM23_42]